MTFYHLPILPCLSKTITSGGQGGQARVSPGSPELQPRPSGLVRHYSRSRVGFISILAGGPELEWVGLPCPLGEHGSPRRQRLSSLSDIVKPQTGTMLLGPAKTRGGPREGPRFASI